MSGLGAGFEGEEEEWVGGAVVIVLVSGLAEGQKPLAVAVGEEVN